MLEALILFPLGIAFYAYLAYPLLLLFAGACRRARTSALDGESWPSISVTIACYNEESHIGETLGALLALGYPRDRLQVLVVSDASTDDTDSVVQGFASRSVELIRMDERSGKTAAENSAGRSIRGELVVSMDATSRLSPKALQTLVRVFDDPTVGVASGLDVSVASLSDIPGVDPTRAESWYVRYEMFVRTLESRLGSIIGASGCFYAVRRELFSTALPPTVSRDFAAPLLARQHGYRSVSVKDAVCFVPRSTSLETEFARKVRTMSGGLLTLWHARSLLNPMAHGAFAWMLISHKLCRWLVYPALPLAVAALIAASGNSLVWRTCLELAAFFTLLGAAAMCVPRSTPLPLFMRAAGFGVVANMAGVWAWAHLIRPNCAHVWEPTRR